MTSILTLADLTDGQAAYIDTLQTDGLLRRRLLDLGFTPGAFIRCLWHSASGDPAAYCIRGTVIALRRNDASQIIITNLC